MLFEFNKVDSPLCYFCEKELETLEHLLFYCPRVHAFWDEVTVMLNSQGITLKSPDIKVILYPLYKVILYPLSQHNLLQRLKISKTTTNFFPAESQVH